jgi:hypothetical protein
MAVVATIVDGQVVSIQSHCSPTQLNASDKLIVPTHLADKPLDELKVEDGKIVEKNTEEKQQLLLVRRWAAVRAVRDFQLEQSDFESHKAFEGVASKDWPDIKLHRQMLRDLPQTYADDIDTAEAILGIKEF